MKELVASDDDDDVVGRRALLPANAFCEPFSREVHDPVLLMLLILLLLLLLLMLLFVAEAVSIPSACFALPFATLGTLDDDMYSDDIDDDDDDAAARYGENGAFSEVPSDA